MQVTHVRTHLGESGPDTDFSNYSCTPTAVFPRPDPWSLFLLCFAYIRFCVPRAVVPCTNVFSQSFPVLCCDVRASSCFATALGQSSLPWPGTHSMSVSIRYRGRPRSHRVVGPPYILFFFTWATVNAMSTVFLVVVCRLTPGGLLSPPPGGGVALAATTILST